MSGLGWHRRCHPFGDREKEAGMLDALMLAAGVAFFAIAVAYVAACEKM
jgi:hypothetical protein